MFLVIPVSAYAELDLEQEVLIIPDTHNEKPYIWNVARNPRGYELIMEFGDQTATTDRRFSFEVRKDPAEKILEMHVFLTDSDLHFFRHIRPLHTDGRYNFSLGVSKTDTFRFEIVFKTDRGWVNLKKDLRLKGGGKEPDDSERDKGYSAKVKLIPKKVYAEHVVTFLFDLAYNGAPIRDIEKVDGFDMQLASWDEDLKEFIYATPRQNLGGPEVAVSTVFMRPGKWAVFAEFRHEGVVRKVEVVVNVLQEPRENQGAIENLKPSDY